MRLGTSILAIATSAIAAPFRGNELRPPVELPVTLRVTIPGRPLIKAELGSFGGVAPPRLGSFGGVAPPRASGQQQQTDSEQDVSTGLG
jgi:hypothetical protein